MLNSLPEPLSTVSFVLEPLEEKHAELDFQALMSCRVRLREELQWGGWPPEDFSLKLNRADLCRHHGEFRRCEAFAYSVLSPDRSQCLGCVYIERCAEIDGAQLAFWVINDAIKIEAVLVTDVLAWIHRDWSINRVLVPLREANRRGIMLAQDLGLETLDSVEEEALVDHRCFMSTK